MAIGVGRICGRVDSYEDYVSGGGSVSDLVLNGRLKFVLGSLKSGCVDEPKLRIVI